MNNNLILFGMVSLSCLLSLLLLLKTLLSHQHKWVQVRDVFRHDKKTNMVVRVYLFCEKCHKTVSVDLNNKTPSYQTQYNIPKKEVKKDD